MTSEKKALFRIFWGGSGTLLLLLAGFNLLTPILPTNNDVELYFRYTRRILQAGEVPYRDFGFEYPPLALPFLVLPGVLCYPFGGLEVERYAWLFHTECFGLALAGLGLLYGLLPRFYAGRNIGWRLAAYTVGCGLISIFLMQRFDMAAAFLTLVAFWFFYRDKPGWAGVALGLAVLTKLYPAVILPPMLLYMWYVRPLRPQIWWLLTGFGIAGGVVLAPFVLIGTDGLRAFVAFHSERGLEVETVFAGVVVFARYLGLTEARVENQFTAFEIISPWSKPLATASTILTIIGLLLIYFWLWRNLRRQSDKLPLDWVITAASLSILWFILANKVLSPQYLIWLLVLLPFWRGRAKIILLLLALPLSLLPFPFLVDWLTRLDAVPYIILAVRNGLLIALLGLLLADLRSTY